ncbi:MAG: small subunit ribosomal protein S1 [Glaciecola sp.]|jgi:small subunit ribosomal protein S1
MSDKETKEESAKKPAAKKAVTKKPAAKKAVAKKPAAKKEEAKEEVAAKPVAEKAPAQKAEKAPVAPVTPAPVTPAPVGDATTGNVDFDWNDLGEEKEVYSADEKAKLEEEYGSAISSIAKNEILQGTIVRKSKREVVINIGYKSEGVISISEFRYDPDLAEGDKVEVYVENPEDRTGQLVLSHHKARALTAWNKVNSALEDGEIIQGFVKCRTKGGLIVDVFGIEAFLPGSQIDVKPIRDYDVYVGKTMEFKVVKINQEFKNVVVSHKALIEAELELQKKEIISKLEKGQVLEGTVKNITSYGVFIDLGGVDGLVHITDLSWGRINHPEEVVELDTKINVVILDFDDDKKRIALGLKQLQPHPWDALDQDLKVGDKVKGKVVVLADYGAFVEIAAGVEGLIHVSEMSWSQHLRSAQDFLNVGDEVEAEILTLDKEERKMSLGIKQLNDDPWSNVEEKYAVNTKHNATIRNFTNFGIFVELEEGIDGLIHISDLSWSKKIKHPSEFATLGDSMEVIVLEISAENRKLSLGHKQLEENPWDVFETVFILDSLHQGTIIEKQDKGYLVSSTHGVEAYCPKNHGVKEDGSTPEVDDVLGFKVIEFNKESKRVLISHAKTYKEEVEGEKKRAPKSSGKSAKSITSIPQEKTTLGDLDVLSSLKDSIAKEEAKK